MTLNSQSIIRALQAKHAEIAGASQKGLMALRAAHESNIRALDEKWGLVERKHEQGLQQSTSEAWTSSLISLHAERKRKNEEVRLKHVAKLEELPTVSTSEPMDTQRIEEALSIIDEEVSKYREALAIKRRQNEFAGDYGEIENEKWIKEIYRFIEKNSKVDQALTLLQITSREAGLSLDWVSLAAQHVNEEIEPAKTLPGVAPSDGGGFEHACLLALHDTGWSATLTPQTGDQGVDILARKNDISLAIQCKNYRTPIGNSAVQEVHAGMTFYEADIGVVVSLSGYTPSATQLAKKLRILLLDQVSLENLDDLL